MPREESITHYLLQHNRLCTPFFFNHNQLSAIQNQANANIRSNNHCETHPLLLWGLTNLSKHSLPIHKSVNILRVSFTKFWSFKALVLYTTEATINRPPSTSPSLHPLHWCHWNALCGQRIPEPKSGISCHA